MHRGISGFAPICALWHSTRRCNGEVGRPSARRSSSVNWEKPERQSGKAQERGRAPGWHVTLVASERP